MALSHEQKLGDGESQGETEDDLFREIWERESQPELRFGVPGVCEVIQVQDLNGKRWQVENFSNTVWEAAIWMHNFFQDGRCFPREWIRGRRVLELGAGTGLVGLTLALLGAEVTMTDLEEALPILEHNTNSTFRAMVDHDSLSAEVGAAKGDTLGPGGKACEADEAARIHPAQKPTIRRLRWGSRADAAAVSEAATLSFEGRPARPNRMGFDMIVGADVIYNDATFAALMSTIGDVELCSPDTLVYLATKLRGGRHEKFLDQLAQTFEVFPLLSPDHANSFRTQIGPSRRDGVEAPSNGDRVDLETGHWGYSQRGSGNTEGTKGSSAGCCGCPDGRRNMPRDGGKDPQWSYDASNLGTVLAFGARRRREADAGPGKT